MEVLKDGQQFAGRYRVVERLASGGMGAVYIAVQEATELKVALKVLWPHVLQTADATDRFQLESRVAARIKSDHIVQVFDAGFDTASQMPFLVMELLDGETLEELVASGGPLSFELTVDLLTQAARALDKAHTYREDGGALCPIVHRDLKPENIFVTVRDNGDRVVKVLDFGIAKILSQSTSVTQQALGTPTYMAYEQALGEAVSPQTDIWALGLIAYYLLTGGCYWKSTRSEGGEIRALFAEILTLPMAPASVRAAEHSTRQLPLGFDDWFAACVHRQAEQRFQSAGQAVRALAACLLGQEPADGPPLLEPAAPGREVYSASTSPQLSSAGQVDDTMMPSVVGRAPAVGALWPYGLGALALGVIGIGTVQWFAGNTATEEPRLAASGSPSAALQRVQEQPPPLSTPTAGIRPWVEPPAPAPSASKSRAVARPKARTKTPVKPPVVSNPKPPPTPPSSVAARKPERGGVAPKPRAKKAKPTEPVPKPVRDPLAGPRR